MDTFDLNTIRDAFEADVTRYVEQARAAAQRCLAGQSSADGWSVTAAKVGSFLAGGQQAKDADWRLLARSVDNIEQVENLTRRILLHIDAACTATATLLQLELAGSKDEAAQQGAQQAAATAALLAEVRRQLGDGKSPTASRPRAVVPSAPVDIVAVLADVGRMLGAPPVADAELEEIEHCYPRHSWFERHGGAALAGRVREPVGTAGGALSGAGARRDRGDDDDRPGLRPPGEGPGGRGRGSRCR